MFLTWKSGRYDGSNTLHEVWSFQGAKESPIVFSLLMSVFADYVGERGRHGVPLLQDKPEIYALIFADDVALVSTTAVVLQNQ